MILPNGYHAGMTDAEIEAAFIAEGTCPEDAHAFMLVLRHPASPAAPRRGVCIVLPRGYHPEMTDEEVVEAYLADGKTRESAELRTRVMRHRR